MIKDTITYKNKTILTLYHQGFPGEQLTQKRLRKEHIERNLIRFSEEYVSDEEWEQLTGYAWEEHALVLPGQKYNPYYERACANMVHRVYLNKPDVIWKKDGTIVEGKDLEKILAFIKKYTSMNLEEHPVFLGDVFLFSASEFYYHTNDADSLILHGLKAGMKVVLHLKKEDDILQTKTVMIEEDTEEMEITAECDWNNHDIEIYRNNELIYINRDISYMKSMQLSFSVAGRKKRIPLTTLQEYYEYEVQSDAYKSMVGRPPEPVRESLAESNGKLVRRLKNQKLSEEFLFIRPGELKVAVKKITDIIFRAQDELWLIDSYFTDKGSGLQQMTDWLRLLCNSAAMKKNVIFYCNNEDKALNALQLKNHIQMDAVIQDAMVQRQSGNVQLFQTKTAIHDRFLLIRNEDTYSGVSIGTSFNSLNSNHYCIHTLAHREAKEVLEVLCAWMETNTAAREECIYDNR